MGELERLNAWVARQSEGFGAMMTQQSYADGGWWSVMVIKFESIKINDDGWSSMMVLSYDGWLMMWTGWLAEDSDLGGSNSRPPSWLVV